MNPACAFVFDLESCEGCIKYDKCLDDYLYDEDIISLLDTEDDE